MITVRATDRMEPSDLAQHMNLRHAEALVMFVSARATERNREVWEAYHRRLHNREEQEHGHGARAAALEGQVR